MVDKDGFRPNVGIVIADRRGRLLWAKRIGQEGWQFPQGGINPGEPHLQALYRELREEVGLGPEDVEVLASTRGWLRYRLPNHMVRRREAGQACVGQKQKWYLLKLLVDDSRICLQSHGKPEFDGWRWVSYWYPVEQVVEFKRNVYRRALKELAPAHCALESAREKSL